VARLCLRKGYANAEAPAEQLPCDQCLGIVSLAPSQAGLEGRYPVVAALATAT
jgi:hypothetical protein